MNMMAFNWKWSLTLPARIEAQEFMAMKQTRYAKIMVNAKSRNCGASKRGEERVIQRSDADTKGRHGELSIFNPRAKHGRGYGSGQAGRRAREDEQIEKGLERYI
jgi:hypothetical protein